LTGLNCGETKVADLSPLRGMALTGLACYGTPVSDLSPLRGMKLTYLLCRSTQVADLSPLEGMNLTEASLTPKNITKGMDMLRHMKGLKTIGVGREAKDTFPAEEFWTKYDAGEFDK